MKKKLFIMLAAVMVFGLAVAVYALNSTSVAADKSKVSCCSGDSCPMKKGEKADAKASCCDDCACCKDGSCPMKKKGEAAAGHAGGHKMADGESCPMMKDGAHKMTAGNDAKAEGANCCGCSCCAAKEKNAEASV